MCECCKTQQQHNIYEQQKRNIILFLFQFVFSIHFTHKATKANRRETYHKKVKTYSLIINCNIKSFVNRKFVITDYILTYTETQKVLLFNYLSFDRSCNEFQLKKPLKLKWKTNYHDLLWLITTPVSYRNLRSGSLS